MLPEYFAIIGALIASLGGLYYLYETIQGKAKPNRVTWILWAVFPMIIFVAQRVQGVEGVSWATLAAGVTPMLVVVASFFNKKAYWKTQPLDYACLAVGVLGIVLWAVTDNANLAIAFSILADFAAAVPTIIKSYKRPETESWVAYAITAAGLLITVFAISTWTFENYAFVLYILFANGLLAVLACRKPQIS